MPTKLRKSRKRRGSRTCGWGKVGQHRGQGAKPNRKSGRHKHKWSYVVAKEPDYFGKMGFTSPKSLRAKVKVINVGRLEEIAEKGPAELDDGKVCVDLDKLGYTKLLGMGNVTKPLAVRVTSCSESATRKIKEANGKVITKIMGEKGE